MKAGRTFVALAIGIVVGLGVASIYSNVQNTSKPVEVTEKTSIDIEVLKESMEKNNELSTSKYLYTAAMAITDVNNLEIIGLPDVKLPFTDATYLIEVDGAIKAGFDLNDADVNTRGENTVVITLPKPKVLSHEMGEVRVKYEQQNIMNPLKAGEESAWISGKKQEMVDRAIELGLYDEAMQNAKTTFEALFEPAIPEGVKLEVEFSENKDGR